MSDLGWGQPGLPRPQGPRADTRGERGWEKASGPPKASGHKALRSQWRKHSHSDIL